MSMGDSDLERAQKDTQGSETIPLLHLGIAYTGVVACEILLSFILTTCVFLYIFDKMQIIKIKLQGAGKVLPVNVFDLLTEYVSKEVCEPKGPHLSPTRKHQNVVTLLLIVSLRLCQKFSTAVS